MPRRSFPITLASLATVPVLLAACGAPESPQAVVAPERAAAQAQPPVSAVAGTLGRLADIPEASTRLAYFVPAAAAQIAVPVPRATLAGIVLGTPGADRLAAAGHPPARAVQVGRAATVLEDAGNGRRVIGAAPALAEALRSTTPPRAVLAPETLSAVQSCLGDPAAEVILGPGLLGPTSAIGASLTDDADSPAGPKLRICAAPHYVRELHAIEERLKAAFGGTGRAAVIGEQEIGEREIVSAIVPVDELGARRFADLLGGGPELRRLAGH